MFWVSERLPLFRVAGIFMSPSYSFHRNVIPNLERVHSSFVALSLWTELRYRVTGKRADTSALVKTHRKPCWGLCIFDNLGIFVLFYIFFRKWIKIFQKLKCKWKVSKNSKIEFLQFLHNIVWCRLSENAKSFSDFHSNVTITDVKNI